jgi:hypothetical protein
MVCKVCSLGSTSNRCQGIGSAQRSQIPYEPSSSRCNAAVRHIPTCAASCGQCEEASDLEPALIAVGHRLSGVYPRASFSCWARKRRCAGPSSARRVES